MYAIRSYYDHGIRKTLLVTYTCQRHHVVARRLSYDFDDIVDCDHTDDPLVLIHNCSRYQVVLIAEQTVTKNIPTRLQSR